MTGKKQERSRRFRILTVTIVLIAFLWGCKAIQDEQHVPSDHFLLSAMSPSSEKTGATSTNRIDQIFDTSAYEGKLTIRYFNLEADEKSGDAIYIESPDGKNMLIDAGIELVGPKLAEFLQELEVEHIDYGIATHPHHDHIGGYLSLLYTHDVGQLLTANVPHITNTYQRFMEVIEDRKVDLQYVEDGDTFMLGKDVKVEIMNPEQGTHPDRLPDQLSTEDINNLSLVVKLTYRNRSFLFTGDIYKEREYELVERYGERLNADMLDAPHHGDSTSSAPLFLQTVRPQYTVISANIFQSKPVYDRYRKYGSEVYVTGVDGHILLVSDGDTIEMITQKDRIGNFLN